MGISLHNMQFTVSIVFNKIHLLCFTKILYKQELIVLMMAE